MNNLKELEEFEELINIILLDCESSKNKLYPYREWNNLQSKRLVVLAERKNAIKNHFDKLKVQLKEFEKADKQKEELNNEEEMKNYEVFLEWRKKTKECNNEVEDKNKGNNNE